MRAVIPDTLEGAIILSIIDFFLSFVIIAGIGVILSFFPLLNRFGPKSGEPEKGNQDFDFHEASAVTADQATIEAHHLVVISAAIHEVMGSHRIVSVESAKRKGC
jgi:hypothetical protein